VSRGIVFKVGGKVGREVVAALLPLAPWYAIPRLNEFLEKITERGVQVEIKKAVPRHTDSQRNFYHMSVDVLAKHLGMTHAETHDAILCEWSGSRQVRVSEARTVDVPLSRSSRLEVEEYSGLITTLEAVFAFNGIPFPDPMGDA
jgi:hypothetical protein